MIATTTNPEPRPEPRPDGPSALWLHMRAQWERLMAGAATGAMVARLPDLARPPKRRGPAAGRAEEMTVFRGETR